MDMLIAPGTGTGIGSAKVGTPVAAISAEACNPRPRPPCLPPNVTADADDDGDDDKSAPPVVTVLEVAREEGENIRCNTPNGKIFRSSIKDTHRNSHKSSKKQ